MVAVGKNAQPAQVLDRYLDAETVPQGVVVAGRGAEEAHAALGEGTHGLDDVVDPERQMLYPRTGVPLEEVVDLAGSPGRVRLDQREGDAAGRALHHRRVHPLPADLDVLLEGLREPEHVLVVP